MADVAPQPPRRGAPTDQPIAPAPPGPVHERPWFYMVGGLLILAGLVALVFPVISTLAATVVIGWLLVFTGIALIVHAFRARRWAGALWSGLVGVAWLVGGLLAIVNPLLGSLSFTLALAGIFLVQGIFSLMGVGFSRRESPGWRILNGIFAIIAAVLIWVWLPGSALWVLGVIAGLNFLLTGVTYLVIGSALAPARTT